MLVDCSTVEEGTVLEHDICVIGAGAAGITIAMELSKGSTSVALLESGGLESDNDLWSLYDGQWEIRGLGHSREQHQTIKMTRLRFLGGTTNHWAGFCSPFDEHDFELREWVPYSGWPITRQDLDPYYERACDYVNVPSFAYDPLEEYGPESERPALDFGSNSHIRTKMFHKATEDPSGRGTPTRFRQRYLSQLKLSSNITLYLNGNCCDLNAATSGEHVRDIEVKTYPFLKSFKIAAKRFVLATGGLENARLLLNSNDVQPEGLGNHRDLVGRFFMGHAHFALDPGLIFAIRTQAAATLPLYSHQVDPFRKHDTFGFFVVAPESQRKYRLLNCNMGGVVWTEPYDPQTEFDRAAVRLLESASRESSQGLPVLLRRCKVNVEQEPNPESRVTLLDEVDELGLRRLRVSARISELQYRSAVKSFELLGRELARADVGRVKIDTDPERMFHSLPPRLGAHHIGTTRMAASDNEGVVDSNAKVFGIDNLYIAGSSIFATGSCANPTFTIVALAIRLADHLLEIT